VRAEADAGHFSTLPAPGIPRPRTEKAKKIPRAAPLARVLSYRDATSGGRGTAEGGGEIGEGGARAYVDTYARSGYVG